MSCAAPDRTIYLDGGSAPVYAVFHPAAGGTRRDIAIVFCPPFGWDEVSSYRSRREWAQRLAEIGYPCIRPSYPSTGDSGGGAHDPGRLDAWTEAVAAAAGWLQATTGARRTAAIGIGLGGLIAYRVAAMGAPIDDLVLWATPARGRAWIRELSAFSKLELSGFYEGLDEPPPLPSGELEAGGFLLSAETVETLSAVDLTELPLPDPAARRVLLLDRDGIAVDPRLSQQLANSGAAVQIGSGIGFAGMASHPQEARAPVSVIERVAAWLEGADVCGAPSRPNPIPTVTARDKAELAVGGVTVTETPLAVAQPFGRLAGILAEPLGQPASALCAVLLNAGVVRRIGPDRMWVEAARRWAARGVPTLRLDIEGLGDADGDPSPYAQDAGLYVPELVPQVLAALDALEQRGTGRRFVLGGLCAGAYWSFHAALQDDRVLAALMLNPRALIWDPRLLPARDFRALISKPPSWSKIREQASGPRVEALARWLLAAPTRAVTRHEDEVAAIIDRFAGTGKRALFVFAENEPLHDELARSGALARLEQQPNVTLEYVSVRDHTLRPNHAQCRAHELLDAAVDRELAAIGHAPVRA